MSTGSHNPAPRQGKSLASQLLVTVRASLQSPCGAHPDACQADGDTLFAWTSSSALRSVRVVGVWFCVVSAWFSAWLELSVPWLLLQLEGAFWLGPGKLGRSHSEGTFHPHFLSRFLEGLQRRISGSRCVRGIPVAGVLLPPVGCSLWRSCDCSARRRSLGPS